MDSIENKNAYRKQYEGIFGSGKKSNGFHAKAHLDDIKRLNIKSLCDVGCGDGQFCVWAKTEGMDPVIGIDWEHPVNGTSNIQWIKDDFLTSGVPSKSVEFVTAFDVLEHFFYYEIDDILSRMVDIATRGMLFTIGHHQSDNMHNIVQPPLWWINKIAPYARIHEPDKLIEDSLWICEITQ